MAYTLTLDETGISVELAAMLRNVKEFLRSANHAASSARTAASYSRSAGFEEKGGAPVKAAPQFTDAGGIEPCTGFELNSDGEQDDVVAPRVQVVASSGAPSETDDLWKSITAATSPACASVTRPELISRSGTRPTDQPR